MRYLELAEGRHRDGDDDCCSSVITLFSSLPAPLGEKHAGLLRHLHGAPTPAYTHLGQSRLGGWGHFPRPTHSRLTSLPREIRVPRQAPHGKIQWSSPSSHLSIVDLSAVRYESHLSGAPFLGTRYPRTISCVNFARVPWGGYSCKAISKHHTSSR